MAGGDDGKEEPWPQMCFNHYRGPGQPLEREEDFPKLGLADLRNFKPIPYPDLHPYMQKVQQITDCLDAPFLIPEYVQQTLFSGVPEESHTRGIFWQYILLNYSPFKVNREQYRVRQQSQYHQFLKEFLYSPITTGQAAESFKLHSTQILKDLKRTQQTLNFYKQQEENVNNLPLEGGYNGYLAHQPLHSPHLSALFRILFVYSNLNIEKYTQGQNELVSQLYIAFHKNRQPGVDGFEVESNTFWCFQEMMGLMRSLFNKDEDESVVGIFAVLKRLDYFVDKLLAKRSIKILAKLQIKSYHFAVTWLTSLFSQNLSGPDCERLWDTIISQIFFQKQKMLQRFGYTLDMQEIVREGQQRLLKSSKQYDQLEAQEKMILECYTVNSPCQENQNNFLLLQKNWIDFLLALCLVVIEDCLERAENTDSFEVVLSGLQQPEYFNKVDVEDFIKRAHGFHTRIDKELARHKTGRVIQ